MPKKLNSPFNYMCRDAKAQQLKLALHLARHF